MTDRATLEMTMIEIARRNGEPPDRHTLYTIRTGIAQALQDSARHRQRMEAPDYHWRKPAPRR